MKTNSIAPTVFPVSKETDAREMRRLIAKARMRAGRVESLDWDKLMFPPQREFINDTSRLKVACCSRRAGKSHSVALALLKAGFEHDGSYPIYINMNRASAKVIIWPALRAINRELDLGLVFDNVTSDIKLPNESVIKVYGAGSRREMDKIRGGKPPAMCLDEAQNMGQDMLYLINEILLPSAADYQASIMVTGTPSNSKHSPFFRISNGMALNESSRLGWSVHHWTMDENPHIPDPEGTRQLALQANDWNTMTPAYRREFLGEWAFDTESLAFVQKESMLVREFPKWLATDWRYILGVDLGTVDPCAFTVLAYSRSVGRCYVLESYREGDMSTIQAGTEIERLMNRYPTFSHIVVDSGGQGASFIRQWKDTHPHIPARPVKKGNDSVDMGISIINADIRAGKLFFVEKHCQDLLQEMDSVQWDERSLEIGKRVIRRGDDDHACDSARYAYTKVRTHDIGGFVVEDDIKRGSPRWFEAIAEKARKQAFSEKKPEPTWVKLGRWKRPGRQGPVGAG